jgi:protein-tyrosine phosphatase
MCRSPLAERLAASWLARGGAAGIDVASAGTHAVVGAAMYHDSETVLRRLGGDAAGFTARQLTGQLIDDADLILTAVRAHREIVIGLRPEAAARTFTLREFAGLAAAVGPSAVAETGDIAARARALTGAAALARAEVAAWPPSKLDIPDPVGRPMAVQEATATLIADAIAGPLGLLVGDPAAVAAPARPAAPGQASPGQPSHPDRGPV